MAERDTVTENSETKGEKRNRMILWGPVAGVVIALACVIAIAVYNYATDSISEQVAQGVSATSTHTAEQTSIAERAANEEGTAVAEATETAKAQDPNAHKMRLRAEMTGVELWFGARRQEIEECAALGRLDLDEFDSRMISIVVDIVMIDEDAQDGEILWSMWEMEQVLEDINSSKSLLRSDCGIE